jgi:enoyl-CoA hydratase/carnithine racemase
MTIEYGDIRVDEEPGIGIVTLHRPERMNAFTARMGLELAHAIAAFDARDDIRAIIVTGAGKAFCAGADLGNGADTFSRPGEDARRLAAALQPATDREPWEMNTPILAAINGHAIGVGLTFTMQWDIRIAAADAKLAFAFNRRGVVPELTSQWMVPRLVGVSRGLQLLLTGETITGARAAEIGLVSEALPADEVLPRTLGIARDIATNVAPVSAALVKRSVYMWLEEPDRKAAHTLEEKMFAWCAKRPDAREGPVAFVEKRAPQWKLSKNTDFPEEFFTS